MAKKILSLIMIIAIGFTVTYGCNNNEEQKHLVIDGEEVILKMGDTYVSADELFGNMLHGEITSSEVFNQVERFVVEKQTRKDQSIINNVRYEVDKLEARAQSNAQTLEISYSEALESELAKKGVSSISEFEDNLTYDLRRDRALNTFENLSEEDVFGRYVNEMMPFHASHILVSLSEANLLDKTQKTLLGREAEQIADIFNRLIKGEKFYNVALFSDDNDTNEIGGDLGLIDLNSNIEDEIKYALMMYALNKHKKDVNIEIPSYLNDFYSKGIESIPTSYLDIFDENASSNTTQVSSYPSGFSSIPSRTKNLIFNTLLNSKTPRAIVNDSQDLSPYSNISDFDDVLFPKEDEIGFENMGNMPLVINGEEHPILIVRSSQGLHFISIHMTPFEEDTDEYFNPFYEGERGIVNFFDRAPTSNERDLRKETLEQKEKDLLNFKLYGEEIKDALSLSMISEFFKENDVVFNNSKIEEMFTNYVEANIDIQKTKFYLEQNDNLTHLSEKLENLHTPIFQRQFIPLSCIGNKIDCSYTLENGYTYENPNGGEE